MAENLLCGILVEAGVHQNRAVVLYDQPGVRAATELVGSGGQGDEFHVISDF